MTGSAGHRQRPTWRLVAVAIGALLWLGAAAQAQRIVSPAKGTPLRAEVLDAMRPTMQAEIGGKLVFVVHTINVMGEWAYVSADPVRPGGQAVDWRKTRFRRDYEADMFSGLVLALLLRKDGQWTLAEYAIGPTDVAWVEWVDKHKLPEDLFKGE
jgi:hypothetical protein